jgi:hypothetical protein
MKCMLPTGIRPLKAIPNSTGKQQRNAIRQLTPAHLWTF